MRKFQRWLIRSTILIEERRYSEAEVVAKQVGELKPGSTIATNMFHKARFASRDLQLREIQADKEELFAIGLMEVERTGSSIDGMRGRATVRDARSKNLARPLPSSNRRHRNAVRQRSRTADQSEPAQLPVSVQYNKRPLGEVIADLSALTGIPIVLNERAMEAVNVTREDTLSR